MKEPTVNFIHNIDYFFDTVVDSNWFSDQYVQYLVKEIDNTEVIQGGLLKSPVLGYIAPSKLSGSVKCLICAYMLNSSYIYRGTSMGDNCYPILFEMSKNKDINIFLRYCPDFSEDTKLVATYVDSNKVVHTMKEFIDEYFELEDSID